MAKLRLWSQVFFLALFLFLLSKTEYRGSLHAAKDDVRLAFPVAWFLQLDPLAALVTALSTWTLYKGLVWSLAILIPTLFLGRFFCGWICPLGTLHHFFSHVKSDSKRGARRIESNRYQSWQALKYYILFAVLAAAACGAGLAGLFDPISLLVRSLALSILPAVNYAFNALIEPLQKSDVRGVRFTAEAFHFLLKDWLISFKQPYFRQGVALGVIFVTLLALNLRITRFWCRALCPLGGLLGIFSRWSILGLEKNASNCADCNRCLLHCQGGDDPIPGAKWRQAECHLCLNCVADCPESGIRIVFFPSTPTTRAAPDVGRRKVLTSLAAGVAAVPVLRATTGYAAEANDRLVRPPGALDEKNFLARCIRCGECMKVCPNNALHPTLAEAGWEGLWSPVLVPRVGYCEASCTLCGQVCPTGAIWEFTLKEKGWAVSKPAIDVKPIRIGTAFYDHGRCLPWSMATECIVCEEWCPTSPKAIYLVAVPVSDAQGHAKTVRQPSVNPAMCVGCGACEYACPVRDRPAIYVTSIGESRSKTNQILLREGKKKADVNPFPETGEVKDWAKSEATRTFAAANLWEYVDGDAEKYLQAGVERTLTSPYKFQKRIDAVADVYFMKNADGARRIFEFESAMGSRDGAVGDASRLYGSSLTFRKGACFVRLTAYEDAPAVAGGLVELARAIEHRLNKPN
jgi:polyferredoxin